MVAPLLAAAVVPELVKVMGATGAQKDVCLFSGRYQPMIRKPGTRKRDNIEIPDPRWPEGWKIEIPAWLFVAGVIITGSVTGAIIMLEEMGMLGGLKEKLGLKKKPNEKSLLGLKYG